MPAETPIFTVKNHATKTVASIVGIFGGLMGMEHGYLETLQGNVAPRSIVIDAISRRPDSIFQGRKRLTTEGVRAGGALVFSPALPVRGERGMIRFESR